MLDQQVSNFVVKTNKQNILIYYTKNEQIFLIETEPDNLRNKADLVRNNIYNTGK